MKILTKNLSAIVGLAVLMQVGACTKKENEATPVKVLERYIDISFNAKGIEDKRRMEDLLTGDTKTRLVSWSDEQFLKAFVETKRKFGGIKILETKKTSETETALTYELSFQEGEGDKKVGISQRKLCVVVFEGGALKIREVRSIRESIEYLKELSLP